ncbi:MAG: carbohydrate kinase family protein, partial [Thaumarchaeota archaeon]|nr:carbohydrate kinase family protein [Nitrososphaerota archaeon]
MPDYFVDRIISTPPLAELARVMTEKVEAGGGSIRNVRQTEVKGGNAVNVAYALGMLGVRTDLVTLARGASKLLLEETFRNLPSVEVIIKEGKPGYTTALEFTENSRHANVMLSDLGDMDSIGPERLGEEVKRVSSASAVAVVNWAANRMGTELARFVFGKAPKKSIRFLDPADISSRSKEFARFVKDASGEGLITNLSVNENEARFLVKEFSSTKIPADYSSKDIRVACQSISEKISLTVDIHTPIGSASGFAGEVHWAPCPKVRQVTITGAGDAWGAADLYGYLAGLQPEARLL